MNKVLKIFLIVFASLLVVVSLLIGALFLFITNVEIRFNPHKQETVAEQVVDQDILDYLITADVIGEDDVYINYDRDIGLFGPEGDKSYIYRREDNSYYYVEVCQLAYSSRGEYLGYEYEPHEVFYRIDVQDCRYNLNSESMDERIAERLGDKSIYIVSGEKDNFELYIYEQTDKTL
ncbi:MAG: hypothetical protein E7563_07850 [Ruminococcaceae bacterium]|nr:hypothetical protein [Oscillospiraceae bacterium]